MQAVTGWNRRYRGRVKWVEGKVQTLTEDPWLTLSVWKVSSTVTGHAASQGARSL